MSRKSKNRSAKKQSVIGVVVTTAGRFDMLEKCLNVLYQEAQTTPLSIVISDINTSPDERKHYAHLFEYQPDKDPARNVVKFQVKHFAQNVGFPMGANEGARLDTSPLLMILNDDVELQAGAIQEVVKTFNDETVGIVGIKLLFPKDSARPGYPAGKIQHVGLSLNIRGEPIHPLVGWSPENQRTRVSRDVWAVTGACLTIRRTLWNQVKGFDLIYGKGTWEDADLCLKVRQLGKRVYLNSVTYGYHYTGASQEKRKEYFPLQQNMMTFQARWGQTGLLLYDEWSYW